MLLLQWVVCTRWSIMMFSFDFPFVLGMSQAVQQKQNNVFAKKFV